MTTIPCIEDRCILYPACRNKVLIMCDKLVKYRRLNYNVFKCFPKLQTLLYEDGTPWGVIKKSMGFET